MDSCYKYSTELYVFCENPKEPIYSEFSELNYLTDTAKNCEVFKYTFFLIKY